MTSMPTHRSGCTLAARLLLGVGILLTGVLPDARKRRRVREAKRSTARAAHRATRVAWHARLTPTRCGNSGPSG